MPHHIAVISIPPERQEEATQLATRLGLTYLDHPSDADLAEIHHLLVFTSNFLGLAPAGEKNIRPFHIDFLSDSLMYRCRQASLRKELLARAVGKHPREQPVLVDATAGLGRDSFILAALGYEITLIERSPIIHALLHDACERAKKDVRTASILNRMRLIQADSAAWMADNASDIIYLDPMFPERKKSASVKKEMVFMQQLLGNDDNANELFAIASRCAGNRIIVKRPRLAQNIANKNPDFSLAGKSSRFDVYLCQSQIKG